jgi:hypothetical protein
MNVFRDPTQNVRVELSNEKKDMNSGLRSGRKTQLPPLNKPPPACLNPAPWAGQVLRFHQEKMVALRHAESDSAS